MVRSGEEWRAWSEEENATLKAAMEEQGSGWGQRDWNAIAEALGTGRTPSAIQAHWQYMHSKNSTRWSTGGGRGGRGGGKGRGKGRGWTHKKRKTNHGWSKPLGPTGDAVQRPQQAGGRGGRGRGGRAREAADTGAASPTPHLDEYNKHEAVSREALAQVPGAPSRHWNFVSALAHPPPSDATLARCETPLRFAPPPVPIGPASDTSVWVCGTDPAIARAWSLHAEEIARAMSTLLRPVYIGRLLNESHPARRHEGQHSFGLFAAGFIAAGSDIGYYVGCAPPPSQPAPPFCSKTRPGD